MFSPRLKKQLIWEHEVLDKDIVHLESRGGTRSSYGTIIIVDGVERMAKDILSVDAKRNGDGWTWAVVDEEVFVWAK